MGFDQNVEMIRLAFYQVLISSGPFLGAALAIGLVIGIIQAATSIQEMTLSFVPKIVIVIFAIGFLANFLLVSLTDYFQFIFDFLMYKHRNTRTLITIKQDIILMKFKLVIIFLTFCGH